MTSPNKRLQVAVIGAGRLGAACAAALIDDGDLALAGLVRRPGAHGLLPARLQRFPVATHVRDLPPVDVALLCVPLTQTAGVAHDLLQARVPLVECAAFEGAALAQHHAALDDAARRHRVTAVVGAGWNPGVLPLLGGAFEMLIPRGHSTQQRHPGVTLHHSAEVGQVAGVRRALEAEVGGVRYVYVELEPGAAFEAVRARIEADPLFAGESTQVFQVDDAGTLEDREHEGMVLERLATPASGRHSSLLLEARFEGCDFAARVMLDAARRLPALPHGAHRYAIGL